MKAFFQNRTLRERMLLLSFALIGLGWWAPVTLGRFGMLRRELTEFRTDLETQRLWLSRRSEIETRAAKAAQTLDPSKTLDASQAYAELNRMASGLTYDIGAQKTQQSEQFALNNVQITIRRADLDGLYHFYEQLGSRAPYLGIEQCIISSDRANPGLLSAVFRVYSIEALPPAK